MNLKLLNKKLYEDLNKSVLTYPSLKEIKLGLDDRVSDFIGDFKAKYFKKDILNKISINRNMDPDINIRQADIKKKSISTGEATIWDDIMDKLGANLSKTEVQTGIMNYVSRYISNNSDE